MNRQAQSIRIALALILLLTTGTAIACGAKTPTAIFETSIASGMAPLSVTLTNESKNADQFTWDFGDGKSEVVNTQQAITHEYTKAGTYTITLTVFRKSDPSQISTTTFIVQVKPGLLHKLKITPTEVDLSLTQTQKFTAEALDAYGNVITDVRFEWKTSNEVGTIDQSGMLTAGTTAGTFSNAVQATARYEDASVDGTASVTIKPGALHQLKIVPESISISLDETFQFSAVCSDAWGNFISGVNIFWETAEGAGTITNSGLFTAGRQLGTFSKGITATAKLGDALFQDSATVTISAASAQLKYSENLSKYGVGYHPQKIGLTTYKPTGWSATEPVFKTSKPLYGLLKFGEGTTVLVAAEEIADKSYVTYIDVNLNGNLADDLPLFTSSYGAAVTIKLSYPEGKRDYKFMIYHWNYPDQNQTLMLSYYRACLWEGTIQLGGLKRIIAVFDDNANGLYGDIDDMVIIDLSGDGQADGSPTSTANETLLALDMPFYLNNNAYLVKNIAQTGDLILIEAAKLGILQGSVKDTDTGLPITGAELSFYLPGYELKATTDAQGMYSLKAPAGSYIKTIVRSAGYVPDVNYYQYWYGINPPRLVVADSIMTKDFSLQPAGALSGQISLTNGDSYHFLAHKMSKLSGGDFYFSLSGGKAMFWANNYGQGGLVDVGTTGSMPLDQVSIPKTGYQIYGVEVIVDHTYISKAKEGEEGCYIVFRVTNLSSADVVIEYLYRLQ